MEKNGKESVEAICIVLVNFENKKDTIKCLKSLRELDYENYHVIVVDNNSTDDSFEKIKEYAKKSVHTKRSESSIRKKSFEKSKLNKYYQSDNLTIVQSVINGGFAYGVNLAIRAALGSKEFSYVWLLNNDSIVKKDTLRKMVEVNQNEKCIVGSAILDYYEENKIETLGGGRLIHPFFIPRRIQRNENYADISKDNNCKIDFVTGASLLAPVEGIRKVGFLDESFFLYWEDAEWCERFKRKGYPLRVSLFSVVLHKKGATTSRTTKTQFFESRNALVYVYRYYCKMLPIALLSRFALAVFLSIRHRKFKILISSTKGIGSFLIALIFRQRDLKSVNN